MSDQIPGKVKGVADIVFLIDATGSMAGCINDLKNNISVFIDSLTRPASNDVQPVKDWRARVVGYRDAEVDGDWFIDNPFVRDAAALKAQLAALQASGGGDEPESLLDALYKICSAPAVAKDESESPGSWRYRSAAARVVVVFTDASFKPTMAIPEARGGGIVDLSNLCTGNRIILSIFAPEMSCYDDLSVIQRSEYFPISGSDPQSALVAFTADQANFRQTLEQLAKSVSKSAEVIAL